MSNDEVLLRSIEARRQRHRLIIETAVRPLESEAASPSAARAWVREVGHAWGMSDGALERLTLVASELVANALLHAVGPYAVVLEAEPGSVRVGVEDRSTTFPVVKAFESDAATGRGLHIVAGYATAWGADRHADGKRVWADVEAPEVIQLAGAFDGARSSGGSADPIWRGRSTASNAALGSLQHTSARTGDEDDLGMRCVRYLEVPVADFIAMRARIEAILRETMLISLGGTGRPGTRPEELVGLARRVTTEFVTVANAEMNSATEPVRTHEGGRLGDFETLLPVAAYDQLPSLLEVASALNGWASSAHLLAPPLTEEQLALYRWSIEEARRQLRDEEPPRAFADARSRAG